MEAPKEIKIQQMPLKYKKFFATFIMGGASFTAFRQEHLIQVKNSYSAWLMREALERGIENISLEDCVRSMADIFWNLDVRSVNHGYKKTGISKFQSEPVLETPLTRDEQVQNLIERFDRFVCSDSDED